MSARRIATRLAAPMLLVFVLALLLGSPAGAFFGSPSTLSSDGAPALSPHIATDSQSNALAVWTEEDSGVRRLRAAFRPSGGDFESLGFISTAGGHADEPVVVFDERDNALAVWTQDEGGFGRIHAAFRPSGGTFGAPQTISGAEPGVDYYQPRVDIDESATAVWTRASDTGDLGVQAAFRPKDGTFGAPQTISAGTADEPDVVVDERGNSLAVWTEYVDGPAVYSGYRPRNGGWSPAGQLSAAGHHAFGPRVAVDGHNKVSAVWVADADGTNDNDPNFIQAAVRFEGESFVAGTTVSADAGTAYEPQVVTDERDNVLIAWSRIVGGVSRVETAYRAHDSQVYETPQTVSGDGVDAYEPRLAVDESATLVWTEAPGPDSTRVQGAFQRKGGTFGGAQLLAEPGDSSYDPAVAVDRQGNAFALWTRNELSDLTVVQFSFRPRVGSFAEPATLSAPAPAGAFEPQIATDRLSNALAVWTVDPDVNDPFNPTWVEAAFANAGGRFGLPERLSDPSRNAYEPRVAFENDGDAVVTWTAEDDSGTLRVHAAFRTSGNGFVSTVLSPDGTDAFHPQVSAGRGSVVVWSRSDGVNTTAEAAVKPENASFLPPQRVSRDGEDANGPQVAVGRDGTAVATWYAGFGDHVAAAIGSTTPAGFAPAATLSPPGMAASHPQVAVDERGDAVAVWIAGDGAFIQTAFRPRGAGFGAAQEIAAENVDEPQVAFDEIGNAIAAWTRYVSDVGQIETAFRPRGGSFGDAAAISGTGEELTNFRPRVATDDSAAVVWTAETPFGTLRVQSAFRPKDGVFGAVQTLTDRLQQAYEPQIAVDERGNALAVWTLTDPATIQSAFRPRV